MAVYARRVVTSPDDWRAAGDHFEWRGHRIFCRTAGPKDVAPLVLIHGFPTASWDWAPLWPRLTERFRVLTLDMIGFGFSAKPRRFAYTIGAQADLFEALLAREGVTRYHILAHDYGDTVAQELLARDRDRGASTRIAAVCLLNGGLFPETHRALLTQKLLASPLGPLLARLTSYRRFARAMRHICKRPLSDEDVGAMWQLVTENDGRAVMPQLIGYMAERRAHRARWVGALVDAVAPLRLINGLDDPISGAHMVARYRELVPRPDVVELPGVGHYPQLEAPDAVADASLAFLTSNAG
jgi:pimeloyl-ACP methyl ester carboxylesterase